MYVYKIKRADINLEQNILSFNIFISGYSLYTQSGRLSTPARVITKCLLIVKFENWV